MSKEKKRMPPLCKYCSKPIWGRYISALGETWHPEHFLCTACGQPLDESQFQLVQGQPYHVACYLDTQAPRCAVCGLPLTGTYTQANQQSYHPECYRDHVAPRCVYCHKPLSNRFLVDSWGNTFCEVHQKDYPACSFCSRLIPPAQQTPGWKLEETPRCLVCRSTAIETAEQAQPLFAELKSWIGQQGLRFHQLPLRLELCGRARLQQLLHERNTPHTLGVTHSSTQIQNGRVVDIHVDGIAVLAGLPADLFAGVVVHELGHVWLIVHRVEHMPLWAEEGFCQLLAHRYHSSIDTAEARYRVTAIAKDTDPIYGDGFRRVHALFERVGFAQCIEHLSTTRNWPASG